MEIDYRLHGTEAGPFSVEGTIGTCPAFGSTNVTVRFDPKDPLMFHKRLFLLVRDHAPLVVDLVGSCFNDKMRPPLLSMKQFTRPGKENASLLPAPESGSRDPVLNDGEGFEDADETDYASGEGASWEALFSDEEENRRRARVSADVTRLDFGACSRSTPSEYKAVTLTNNGDERVTCTWLAPDEKTQNPADGIKLYQVFPQEAEIRPGGSFIFNVVFRPKRDSCYYCDDLEALVVPKRLRQWDAAQKEVPPPSVLRLRVGAHFSWFIFISSGQFSSRVGASITGQVSARLRCMGE